MTANRLATETSPYLRQHAQNPVDWYPWGREALERAAAEDKPIFLSIGYASCHWCHVMAHESFEDPQTAAELGRGFVAVKVDREERPDLDAVYMAAVQAISGSGGWPMSVFCTPDGRPFFAGTYFPSTDRQGMPSFRRVLAALQEAWRDRRDEVEQQADALAGAVTRDVRMADRLTAAPDGGVPSFDAVLDTLVGELDGRFDPEWGGFGAAPKFPRPGLVELCLRHHRRTGLGASQAMATTTLHAMAAGGIYDHLAGGFARYATDRRWLVPHFEKMLTDQALLARGYLHGWQSTGRAAYRQVATETLDYVLSDLSGPGGGLFSSVDADADGVEGGHATFTADQVSVALGDAGRPDLEELARSWYGVTDTGNWEGTNVLHRPLGAPLARPDDVETARAALLAARRRRPQPALDDKVLTEWNAMTAATLAQAAAAIGRPDWAQAAEGVLEFCFAELRRPDGRWLRSWQGGQARHLAFAADYAWVVEACTRMGELTGAIRWTERATEVADGLLGLFWDGEGAGGLFTTGHDGEGLVVRPKDLLDGAVPSANSVAGQALLRLGALTGADTYREHGERILAVAAPVLAEHPLAVADLVGALAQRDGAEVVVAGERPDLLAEIRGRWLPAAVLAWGERGDSPLWQGRENGMAYVCRGFTCHSPARDTGTLAAQLDDLTGN